MGKILSQESTGEDIFLETMRELSKLPSSSYVGVFLYYPNEEYDIFKEYLSDVKKLGFDENGLKFCDEKTAHIHSHSCGSRKLKELEKVGLRGRVLQSKDGVFIIETGYWIEKYDADLIVKLVKIDFNLEDEEIELVKSHDFD